MTDTKLPNARINAALAALQMDLPRVAKDNSAKVETKAGGSYRYTYADLADVSDAIMPRLGKHGLSFTSRPTLHEGKFVLLYELRHESGEEIPGVYPLSDRATPQETGGLITYARRYCLCAITGVAPADGDDDAQMAEAAAKRRQRRGDRGGQQEIADDTPRITSGQQREMQSLFQQLGITDKTERLRFAAAAAKRELRSATELKEPEADAVLKTLRHAVSKKAAQASPANGSAEAADVDQEKWLESQQPPAGAVSV